MAGRFMRAVAGASCTLCALFSVVTATPNAALPFNSQVPPVARIGQPYEFQISDSSFAPQSQNYVYSLSDQPAWLTIDSTTRTLRGTPGGSDVGSDTFTLTAADESGAAHMQCTLVVSSDPAPQITGSISDQLAETANLSSSQPPVVTLLPSTTFTFDFEQDSFIDIIQRKLYYYATLADHTPLPSWLQFDSDRLAFSGVAPGLSAFPQSWDVSLIASDVAGFAGTSSSFTLAIGTQQLVFVPEEQDVNITAGRAVNITLLKNELYRNNAHLDTTDLRSAEASAPSWLTFDPSTLDFRGQAPTEFESANVTVTVTDQLGNNATAIVTLVGGNSTLFQGQIGTLVARAGQDFRYHFADSLFSDSALDLAVDIPESASWLTYDSTSRELEGTAPELTQEEKVELKLIARASAGENDQTHAFTIDIRPATSTSGNVPTQLSPSATTTAGTAANSKQRKGLEGGVIAGIVIACVVGALILIGLLIWFCRRRRSADSYVQRSPSPSKSSISRPIPPPFGNGIAANTSIDRDVEKTAGIGAADSPTVPAPTSKPVELPPQIQLNLPSHSDARKRRSKWSKRFSRVSLASSLGVGEDAIRADENIPELGLQPPALHTPHDSFGIPAEMIMARNSRNPLDDVNASRRSQALKKLKNRHSRHRSGASHKRPLSGLGIEGALDGGIARHSLSRTQRRVRKTTSSFGALTTTMEASSRATSLRTTRTSILSTKASDFPAPPASKHSTALSVYTLAAPIGEDRDQQNPKRKSIRHVGRSDSIADERPLDVKRQSFIKSRASSSWNSPLFAHGSRATSNSIRQTTGQHTANASSVGSVRRSRPVTLKSLPLTTYSESSSLEPRGHMDSPHRDSRRFSQRMRETFAPNYPRAITRSTLYADEDRIDEGDSAGSWTTSSVNSEDIRRNDEEWQKDLTKPRQERKWVLPWEASPTPPPIPPPDRPGSRMGNSPASAGAGRRWSDRKSRGSSASPLSHNVQVVGGNSSGARHAHTDSKNQMSAPISLVSADSMHGGRPKIGQGFAKRPVSVEDVQRLSSLRAQNDTVGGASEEESRNWLKAAGWESDEDVVGAGLIPPLGSGKIGDTMMSDLSGPAFL